MKKATIFIIVVTLSVIFFAAFLMIPNVVGPDLDPGEGGGGSSPPPSAMDTYVTGYVKNLNGNPLQAIAVKMVSSDASIVKMSYTNKDGYYSITVSLVSQKTFTIKIGVYNYGGWVEFFSDDSKFAATTVITKTFTPGLTYNGVNFKTNGFYTGGNDYTFHWGSAKEWSHDFRYQKFDESGSFDTTLNWAGYFGSSVDTEVNGLTQDTQILITSLLQLEHDLLEWRDIDGNYQYFMVSGARMKYAAYTDKSPIDTNYINLYSDPCHTNAEGTATTRPGLFEIGIKAAYIVTKGIITKSWFGMGIDLLKLANEAYTDDYSEVVYYSESYSGVQRVLNLTIDPVKGAPMPYPSYSIANTRYFNMEGICEITIPTSNIPVRIDCTYEFDLSIARYLGIQFNNQHAWDTTLLGTYSVNESFYILYQNM